MGMPVRLLGWSQEAIDKARMYELSTMLTTLAAARCPELLKFTTRCVERLCPLRLSPGGRQLRAWGRDYRFNQDDAILIKKLVRAFRKGCRMVFLGEGVLLTHQAFLDGLIQRNGGDYWLEEPSDEKAKPKLVVYVDAAPDDAASLKSKALAILFEHPDWSDKRIAAEVPCGRSTLYTWPEFVMARQAQKSGRAKYQKDFSVDDEVDLD